MTKIVGRRRQWCEEGWMENLKKEMARKQNRNFSLDHYVNEGITFIENSDGSTNPTVSSPSSSYGGRSRSDPVSLMDQIRMLQEKRWAALQDLNYLEQIHQEGGIAIGDLDIDLSPTIRNQNRANSSLNRVVSKIATLRARQEGIERRRRVRGSRYEENIERERTPPPPLPLLPPPPPPPAPVVVQVEVDEEEVEEGVGEIKE